MGRRWHNGGMGGGGIREGRVGGNVIEEWGGGGGIKEGRG